MTDLRLRFSVLEAAQLGEIKAIDRDSFPASEQYEAWVYDAMIERPDFLVVIACEQTEVAAYAFLDFGRSPIRLRSVAVHPQKRRMGVGEALLGYALERAGSPVELLVEERNAQAIRLYERLGFVFIDSEPELPKRLTMRWDPRGKMGRLPQPR